MEFKLWRRCFSDRIRWTIREHRNPLRTRTFHLGGREYPYFFHPYNHTWANERAVEIPYVREFLGKASPSTTLEVGNVLSHYFDIGHTVIDKWERCTYRPVLNQDLLAFRPGRRFDVIVSISTIEHVGWDERPRQQESVITALRKVQALLTPDGKALVTIPVGYNQYLDQKLPDVLSETVSVECLKRISRDNEWVEVDLVESLACKYDTPFRNANSVVFLRMSRGTDKTGEEDG
ncbi:class I SAM-dependent methyltransferase [Candidatus Fermentibacteria bacterium]|nr:class I SAM-dependent methyltransferase [Candidatus Fermentibacteria bacterium]